MPKIRARKKRRAKASTRIHQSPRPATIVTPVDSQPVPTVSRALPVRGAQGTRGLQSLVMSALVALGCWAFAYYTFLFYRDTNSYLFAGMAALLALVWSISFFVRLRKWRRR